MIILFGTRGKVHDHGPTIAATCPHCHNSVVLHDVQMRTWFTLFFIPVFPLGRGRRTLMCPICRWTRDVPKSAEPLTSEMGEITKQWQAGALRDDEYGKRVEAYWSFATPAAPPAAGTDVSAS